MAPRTIVRSLSRMAVAVAALMVAVSVIIGVGVMIASFRQTVELWLDDVLQADIFISPPEVSGSATQTSLDPALLNELLALPGIKSAATTRQVDVTAQLRETGDPLPLRVVALEPGSCRTRSALPYGCRRLAADVAGRRTGEHPHQRADGHPA